MSEAREHAVSANHWAVVGGGMLGLALAYRLSQHGQRVTLLEAAPQLGGLTGSWCLATGDGRAAEWDRYYHVTLLSDTTLRGLLEEIGLADDMRWVETKTGFYSGGELFSMSNSLEFLRFPPLSLVEKFRLGGTIFYASRIKDWRPLEKIPVADWLRKHSGEGVFNKIWLPLLKAKLGEAYKETSAAFIWAHINRMYAARRSGLKKEMFGYVRGGYARILRRMEEVLRERGVEIMTSAPVHEAVATLEGGVRVRAGEHPTKHFDRVAFTVPSPIIANACPGLVPEETRRHQGIKYLGIVCGSLLLEKPISPYYVTNITDTWVPLTAVIEMTTIVHPDELGGRSLVYLPKYVVSDDPLFDESDESLRERWVGTLEKMYPHFSRDQVAAFQVSRARHVMALPTLDYSSRLPPMKTSVPGVYAINSAHILKGNLNVNETIQVADEAIATVLRDELAGGDEATIDSSADQTVVAPAAPRPTQPADDDQADRELIARS
ncbi:MAG: NAD(P)/FAD-dependent oxidoreductase [Planctomycetota bacterium]